MGMKVAILIPHEGGADDVTASFVEFAVKDDRRVSELRRVRSLDEVSSWLDAGDVLVNIAATPTPGVEEFSASRLDLKVVHFWPAEMTHGFIRQRVLGTAELQRKPE